mmetsp:Transcript_1142/g.3196  ORF Transcript_1142/g.3196 Transcript_1142/m.3196 type:complete len:223 (-) Transcript_1142:116-784(-)
MATKQSAETGLKSALVGLVASPPRQKTRIVGGARHSETKPPRPTNPSTSPRRRRDPVWATRAGRRRHELVARHGPGLRPRSGPVRVDVRVEAPDVAGLVGPFLVRVRRVVARALDAADDGALLPLSIERHLVPLADRAHGGVARVRLHGRAGVKRRLQQRVEEPSRFDVGHEAREARELVVRAVRPQIGRVVVGVVRDLVPVEAVVVDPAQVPRLDLFVAPS